MESFLQEKEKERERVGTLFNAFLFNTLIHYPSLVDLLAHSSALDVHGHARILFLNIYIKCMEISRQLAKDEEAKY